MLRSNTCWALRGTRMKAWLMFFYGRGLKKWRISLSPRTGTYRLGPLIWNLKPRYIFTPTHDSVAHFERAPYENVDMKSGEFLHPTRFIALTSAEGVSSNTAVKRSGFMPWTWFRQNLSRPLTLAKRPDDCTTNPFYQLPVNRKNHVQVVQVPWNYFFQVADDSAGKRKLETILLFGSIETSSSRLRLQKCHSDAHYYRDCIYKDSTLQPDAKSTYVCHICHEPVITLETVPRSMNKQWNNAVILEQP